MHINCTLCYKTIKMLSLNASNIDAQNYPFVLYTLAQCSALKWVASRFSTTSTVKTNVFFVNSSVRKESWAMGCILRDSFLRICHAMSHWGPPTKGEMTRPGGPVCKAETVFRPTRILMYSQVCR